MQVDSFGKKRGEGVVSVGIFFDWPLSVEANPFSRRLFSRRVFLIPLNPAYKYRV